MGLIDKLRQAEEQGRGAAHRGLERGVEAWEDAERRLRRKMRLHPRGHHEDAPAPVLGAAQPVSSNSNVVEEALPNRASEEDAA